MNKIAVKKYSKTFPLSHKVYMDNVEILSLLSEIISDGLCHLLADHSVSEFENYQALWN